MYIPICKRVGMFRLYSINPRRSLRKPCDIVLLLLDLCLFERKGGRNNKRLCDVSQVLASLEVTQASYNTAALLLMWTSTSSVPLS